MFGNKEKINVEVVDNFIEDCVDMGGIERHVVVEAGETGVLTEKKNGWKLKLDNVTEPPNGGKLVVFLTDEEKENLVEEV